MWIKIGVETDRRRREQGERERDRDGGGEITNNNMSARTVQPVAFIIIYVMSILTDRL